MNWVQAILRPFRSSIDLIVDNETIPSPPRDQSCMMIDLAFWFCSDSIEASRAQLSTVFHIRSTSPFRNAASLAAGSSSSTNFTSNPYRLRKFDAAFASRPALNTTPGAWPAHVLMATTSGRVSLPPPESATPVTPAAPVLRAGSAGALPSASKSLRPTSCDTCVPAGLSPTAQRRMSAPL